MISAVPFRSGAVAMHYRRARWSVGAEVIGTKLDLLFRISVFRSYTI
jgi:hypothetical protein